MQARCITEAGTQGRRPHLPKVNVGTLLAGCAAPGAGAEKVKPPPAGAALLAGAAPNVKGEEAAAGFAGAAVDADAAGAAPKENAAGLLSAAGAAEEAEAGFGAAPKLNPEEAG